MLLLLSCAAALLPLSPLSRNDLPSATSSSRRAVLLGASSAAAAAAMPMKAAMAQSDDLFKPKPDTLKGKTIVITGANTGLGLESAKRLAAGGAKVVLMARSQEKADGAAAEVRKETGVPADRIVGVTLDLASLESIRTVPKRLESALGASAPIEYACCFPPQHRHVCRLTKIWRGVRVLRARSVLLNNAGVMAIPERLRTDDGFERTMGVNHLGHFALVAALLPAMRRASNGFRVINVSSDAHKFVTSQSLRTALDADLDPQEYSAWGAYAAWPAPCIPAPCSLLPAPCSAWGAYAPWPAPSRASPCSSASTVFAPCVLLPLRHPVPSHTDRLARAGMASRRRRTSSSPSSCSGASTRRA